MTSGFNHPLQAVAWPQGGPLVGGGRKLSMTTPIPEDELEETELYIEPFIAYRAWAVHPDEETGKMLLRSLTYKVDWPSGEPMEAKCMLYENGYNSIHRDTHKSPDAEHSCGIHAVKEIEDAHLWMNQGFYITAPELRCVGEVKLWGKVYRYTKGYLAQYAYPSKIWVDPIQPEKFPVDSKEAAHELRRTYRGVEVKLL